LLAWSTIRNELTDRRPACPTSQLDVQYDCPLDGP
jgi:hypothetical protein